MQNKLNDPRRQPGRTTVQRHLLTGVLQCGEAGCGGYLSGYQTGKGVGAAAGQCHLWLRPARGGPGATPIIRTLLFLLSF